MQNAKLIFYYLTLCIYITYIMYLYMYIYIYIYLYYVHIYIYIYIYISISIYIYNYLSIYLSIYMVFSTEGLFEVAIESWLTGHEFNSHSEPSLHSNSNFIDCSVSSFISAIAFVSCHVYFN